MAYIGAGITRFNTADELTVTGTSEFGGNVSFGDNNITNVGSLQIDSIAGDADTNTNITFAGSDVITMTTAGSERVRVDASGHVLVNNTAYGANGTLVVQQTADSKGIAIIDSAAANTFFLENDGTINRIRNNASVPLTLETASTERMRITSSGLVGIGESSPSFDVGNTGIHIGGASSPAIRLKSTTTGSGDWEIYADSASTGGLGFYEHQNNATYMYLSEGGLLGISTTSPTKKISASIGLNDTDGLALEYNGENRGGILLNPIGGEVRMGAQNSTGTYFTTLYSNGSERMRIDASGNVLVGTTNTDPAFNNVTGQSMAASGQFQVTRDGGTAALFNRKSSNGEIVSLRKDSATVGSISSSTGVTTDLILDPRSSFGSGISGAGLAILPMDHSQRADNHTDLGEASNRWKDLYLSGGAYIGGTGSSNYLNDYEEGTWTPAVANGTVTVGNNRYTKIGNIVNLRCQLSSFSDRSSSAAITISGLPFGSGSASSTAGVVLGRYNDAGDGPIVANIGNSASIMNLYGMSDGGNWAGINHSNLNNAAATFLINITYSVS
jgi:hypothetical protein